MALVETLELLTPAEQRAILAVAEFLKSRRADGADARVLIEALLAELPAGEPASTHPTKVYRLSESPLAASCAKTQR